MGFIDRLKGDAVFLGGMLRALRKTTPIARHPDRVFPNIVEELAEKFGDAPALIGQTEQLTYRMLADRSNR
jgi:fatty-acyl-CoA synthase